MSRTRSDESVGRPWWQWVLMLVVLGVLVYPAHLGALWVYRKGKNWRAEQLANEAKDLRAQHMMSEAQAKVASAYTLAPFDPVVLREAAHFVQAAGDAHALGYYHELLDTPEATREDKRDAVRACLLFNETKTGSKLAAELTESGGEAEDYALQGQVLWQGGG